MMMSLGMFTFGLDTLAYQELQRRTSWRWAHTSRLGVRPAGQFLGPGEDDVTLSGVLVPEVAGDPVSLAKLREMGDQGEVWPLVDGTGEVYGAFKIESVDERQSYHYADGTPRRIEFTLQLSRGDDAEQAA